MKTNFYTYQPAGFKNPFLSLVVFCLLVVLLLAGTASASYLMVQNGSTLRASNDTEYHCVSNQVCSILHPNISITGSVNFSIYVIGFPNWVYVYKNTTLIYSVYNNAAATTYLFNYVGVINSTDIISVQMNAARNLSMFRMMYDYVFIGGKGSGQSWEIGTYDKTWAASNNYLYTSSNRSIKTPSDYYHYWNISEGNGNTLNDLNRTNAWDVSLSGSPIWTTDTWGTALKCDGNDDVGTFTSSNFSGDDITFYGWFNVTDNPSQSFARIVNMVSYNIHLQDDPTVRSLYFSTTRSDASNPQWNTTHLSFEYSIPTFWSIQYNDSINAGAPIITLNGIVQSVFQTGNKTGIQSSNVGTSYVCNNGANTRELNGTIGMIGMHSRNLTNQELLVARWGGYDFQGNMTTGIIHNEYYSTLSSYLVYGNTNGLYQRIYINTSHDNISWAGEQLLLNNTDTTSPVGDYLNIFAPYIKLRFNLISNNTFSSYFDKLLLYYISESSPLSLNVTSINYTSVNVNWNYFVGNGSWKVYSNNILIGTTQDKNYTLTGLNNNIWYNIYISNNVFSTNYTPELNLNITNRTWQKSQFQNRLALFTGNLSSNYPIRVPLPTDLSWFNTNSVYKLFSGTTEKDIVYDNNYIYFKNINNTQTLPDKSYSIYFNNISEQFQSVDLNHIFRDYSTSTAYLIHTEENSIIDNAYNSPVVNNGAEIVSSTHHKGIYFDGTDTITLNQSYILPILEDDYSGLIVTCLTENNLTGIYNYSSICNDVAFYKAVDISISNVRNFTMKYKVLTSGYTFSSFKVYWMNPTGGICNQASETCSQSFSTSSLISDGDWHIFNGEITDPEWDFGANISYFRVSLGGTDYTILIDYVKLLPTIRDIQDNNFSYSATITPDSLSNALILQKSNQYVLNLSNNKYVCSINGSSVVSNHILITGVTDVVGCVLNNSNLEIWINSVRDNSSVITSNTNIFQSVNPIIGQGFTGTIDEVEFNNSIFTASDFLYHDDSGFNNSINTWEDIGFYAQYIYPTLNDTEVKTWNVNHTEIRIQGRTNISSAFVNIRGHMETNYTNYSMSAVGSNNSIFNVTLTNLYDDKYYYYTVVNAVDGSTIILNDSRTFWINMHPNESGADVIGLWYRSEIDQYVTVKSNDYLSEQTIGSIFYMPSFMGWPSQVHFNMSLLKRCTDGTYFKDNMSSCSGGWTEHSSIAWLYSVSNIYLTPILRCQNISTTRFATFAESCPVGYIQDILLGYGTKAIGNFNNFVYINNSKIKIGFDLNYGGTLQYMASMDTPSKNILNLFGVGRVSGTSYYDENAFYADPANSWMWEYNPIMPSDIYGRNASIISYNLTNNSLHVVSNLVNYHPTYGAPFLTDMIQYTTYTLDNENPVIIVNYTYYHNSSDSHGYRVQEVPGFYAISEYNQMYFYNSSSELNALNLNFGQTYAIPNVIFGALVNRTTNYGVGIWDWAGYSYGFYNFSNGYTEFPYYSPTNYIGPQPSFGITPYQWRSDYTRIYLGNLTNMTTYFTNIDAHTTYDNTGAVNGNIYQNNFYINITSQVTKIQNASLFFNGSKYEISIGSDNLSGYYKIINIQENNYTGSYVLVNFTSGLNYTMATFWTNYDVTAPASATNPQTTTGDFFINNTWTNPTDPDFNHIWFRYANGTTITEGNQTGTYLNISYPPHYTQNISAQTVDTAGNVNATKIWFNATIQNNPITLFNVNFSYNITAGQYLLIDANYTDLDDDTGTFADNASEWNIDSNGLVNWTSVAGVYNWQINVSDGYGSVAMQNITVTVAEMVQTFDNDSTTFWVRIDGNNSCNGQNNMSYATNLTSCAWLTVQTAASTLTAGQTVRVQAGTYNEAIIISNSGNSTHNIKIIGDKNPILDRVNGTGNAFDINLNSYIYISGFYITRYNIGVEATSNYGIDMNNLTVINSTFLNITTVGINIYSGSPSQTNYNYIISDNIFDTIGDFSSANDCDVERAISINRNTNLLIKNNTIINSHGGICGIDLYNSTIMENNFSNNPGRLVSIYGWRNINVINNTMINNSERNIRFDHDGLNVVIENNYIKDGGWGIDIYDNNTFRIINNTILNSWFYTENDRNSTISNNIIDCQSNNVDITNASNNPYYNENLTIINNVFKDCGYVKIGGLTVNSTVKNNIFYNSPVEISASTSYIMAYNDLYNSVVTGGTSSNSITNDPLFVNASLSDFHLKSQYGRWNGTGWTNDAVTSLVIDAGDPTSDYSNEPIPNGGRINMGAYGNTQYASKSQTISESMPPTPTNLTSTQGNFWINYTWWAGAGNQTISYNVSQNGSWTNGSLNYSNNSVGAHGWSNISVWAFNNSGDGSLSLQAASNNTQVANNFPTIYNISQIYTIYTGDTLYIDAQFIDVDGDDPSLPFGSNKTKGFFYKTTGVLAWPTISSDVGIYNWYINMSDGEGGLDIVNFTVNVNAIPSISFVPPMLENGSINNTGLIYINTSVVNASYGHGILSQDNDLVLFLPMNDTSGKDYSGYNNNANFHGNISVNISTGVAALDFDNNSYIEINVQNTTIFNFTQSYTIEADIYPRTYGKLNQGVVIDKTQNQSYSGVKLRLSSQNKTFVYQSGDNMGSDTGENLLNTWTHVVIYFDNSSGVAETDAKQYHNNNLVSTDKTVNIIPNNKNITIGGDILGNYNFDGLIRNVKIYNSGISSDRINSSYNVSLYPLNMSFYLVEGKHNFTAFIMDYFGYTNQTEKRYITVSSPTDQFVPPIPINLTPTQGTFWINYTWEAGTGNKTDSYNVSVNGTWTNGSSNWSNGTVNPHGWRNISVYAFNNSGNGSLNLTVVSNNTQVKNNIPVLAAIGAKSIEEDQLLSFTISATDADTDTLFYAQNGSGTVNSASGAYSWTPSNPGTYYVNFTSNDSLLYGGLDYEVVTITVTAYTPPNLRLSGTVIPASSTIAVTGQGQLTGGAYDFGQVFIAGSTVWVNVSRTGYYSNNSQVTFASSDIVYDVNLVVVPVNGTPNVTSWGNNYTNNASLSFFAEKGWIAFNITANQTLTGCTWTGATQINCTDAKNNFTVAGNQTVTYQGTNGNGSTQVITWTVQVNGSSGLTLAGYVVNVLSVPLQNARVDFNGSFALTNSTGYYSFSNVNEGTYSVLARQVGYKNNSVTYFINNNSLLNFTLKERGNAVSAPGFDGISLSLILITLFIILRRKK